MVTTESEFLDFPDTVGNTQHPNANAFPYVIPDIGKDFSINPGLTKRELFAALIMQGIAANPSNDGYYHFGSIYASEAVKYADALIAALSQ